MPFIWSEHWMEIITTALLSLVPTFEGRYAVAVGIAIGMPRIFTFLLALVMSSLPIPFIFWFLRPLLDWFFRLPIRFLNRLATWIEDRCARKAQSLNTKGVLGLFLFVAIPLPGTGVWTGTGIATLLHMDKRRASLAILAGNIVACALMTFLSDTVLSLF